MGKLTPAVLGLVVVNVLVFAVAYLAPGMRESMQQRFALYFPRHEHFAWWQFLTSMFMHGGPAHILFNMFALVSFGQHLERLWGVGKFLLFYMLCGIGAGLVYTAVNWFQFQSLYDQLFHAGVPDRAILAMLTTGQYDPVWHAVAARYGMQELYGLYNVPMVGASGAIYGVLVAFGLTWPRAKLALMFLPVPVAAMYFIPVLLGLDLLSGVTGFSLFGGGIAHFAHLGGALIGFLLMWFWRSRARRAVPLESFTEPI